MIKVGIIGGAGYTAGELIRLLINHPQVEIIFVNSESNAGNPITAVHGGLVGDTELKFTDEAPLDAIDCLFLCSGHGASSRFWETHQRPASLKVVDLAQDYRDESCGYVYGLTEVNRGRIAGASLVANPGCFATAIQLALLPLAAAGLLTDTVHVTGITGSTGAGVKPGATTHFSWRDNNMSVYKAFNHQHLLEINRTLISVQPDRTAGIDFIPMRGDFTRGIFVTAYTRCDLDLDQVKDLYKEYYSDAPFTYLSDKSLDLKQVVNTNKCLLWLEKHDDKLLVVSVIDNLLKGASGQAVQNMNIMFGLAEDAGLRLKPSAF